MQHAAAHSQIMSLLMCKLELRLPIHSLRYNHTRDIGSIHHMITYICADACRWYRIEQLIGEMMEWLHRTACEDDGAGFGTDRVEMDGGVQHQETERGLRRV